MRKKWNYEETMEKKEKWMRYNKEDCERVVVLLCLGSPCKAHKKAKQGGTGIVDSAYLNFDWLTKKE